MCNYAHDICKNVVPPKQTARLQITDVRYARLGKDVLAAAKAKHRKAQRKKAKSEGTSAKLEAGPYEVLDSMIQIHKACKADGEKNNGVVKAARMTGYLAYEVTKGSDGALTMSEARGERPACSCN